MTLHHFGHFGVIKHCSVSTSKPNQTQKERVEKKKKITEMHIATPAPRQSRTLKWRQNEKEEKGIHLKTPTKLPQRSYSVVNLPHLRSDIPTRSYVLTLMQ